MDLLAAQMHQDQLDADAALAVAMHANVGSGVTRAPRGVNNAQMTGVARIAN